MERQSNRYNRFASNPWITNEVHNTNEARNMRWGDPPQDNPKQLNLTQNSSTRWSPAMMCSCRR